MKMKKEYIKPEISIIPIVSTQLMAGSGPGAGDQGDPGMTPAPEMDDLMPATPEEFLGFPLDV